MKIETATLAILEIEFRGLRHRIFKIDIFGPSLSDSDVLKSTVEYGLIPGSFRALSWTFIILPVTTTQNQFYPDSKMGSAGNLLQTGKDNRG